MKKYFACRVCKKEYNRLGICPRCNTFTVVELAENKFKEKYSLVGGIKK